MSNYLDKIDAFLDGELSKEETRNFEVEMTEDSNLLDEVRLQKEMRALYSDDNWIASKKSSENNATKPLIDFFKSEEAERLKIAVAKPLKAQEIKPNKYRWYSYAAAIIILFGLTYSYIFFSQSSLEKLYDTNIALTEMPSFVTRGANDDPNLKKGQAFFENENYKKAVKAFKTYLKETDTINSEVYIYLAMSNTELSNFDKALNYVSTLEQMPGYAAQKAPWYKLLVLLKKKDEKEARKTLNSILDNPNAFHYKDAVILEKELK